MNAFVEVLCWMDRRQPPAGNQPKPSWSLILSQQATRDPKQNPVAIIFVMENIFENTRIATEIGGLRSHEGRIGTSSGRPGGARLHRGSSAGPGRAGRLDPCEGLRRRPAGQADPQRRLQMDAA